MNKNINKGYENENILFFYVLIKKKAEYIQIMYPV